MGGKSVKIVLPPLWKGVYSKRKKKIMLFLYFNEDPFSDDAEQGR